MTFSDGKTFSNVTPIRFWRSARTSFSGLYLAFCIAQIGTQSLSPLSSAASSAMLVVVGEFKIFLRQDNLATNQSRIVDRQH